MASAFQGSAFQTSGFQSTAGVDGTVGLAAVSGVSFTPGVSVTGGTGATIALSAVSGVSSTPGVSGGNSGTGAFSGAYLRNSLSGALGLTGTFVTFPPSSSSWTFPTFNNRVLSTTAGTQTSVGASFSAAEAAGTNYYAIRQFVSVPLAGKTFNADTWNVILQGSWSKPGTGGPAYAYTYVKIGAAFSFYRPSTGATIYEDTSVITELGDFYNGAMYGDSFNFNGTASYALPEITIQDGDVLVIEVVASSMTELYSGPFNINFLFDNASRFFTDQLLFPYVSTSTSISAVSGKSSVAAVKVSLPASLVGVTGNATVAELLPFGGTGATVGLTPAEGVGTAGDLGYAADAQTSLVTAQGTGEVGALATEASASTALDAVVGAGENADVNVIIIGSISAVAVQGNSFVASIYAEGVTPGLCQDVQGVGSVASLAANGGATALLDAVLSAGTVGSMAVTGEGATALTAAQGYYTTSGIRGWVVNGPAAPKVPGVIASTLAAGRASVGFAGARARSGFIAGRAKD